MRFPTNTAAMLVMAALLSSVALADHDQAIAPPTSHPFGASYDEWSARWWAWIYSIPAVPPNWLPNPLFTNGRVDCSYRQSTHEGSEHVWFLVGVISGTAERTCTLPAGTALFFPMFNAEADNVGFDQNGATPPTHFDVPTLEGFVQGGVDSVIPHATIDNVPVSNASAYRARFAPFGFTVPRVDNLYGVFGAQVPGISWPNTRIFPVAADGYYLMVEPLAPGRHTINFGAMARDGSFQINITYHLVVRSDNDQK